MVSINLPLPSSFFDEEERCGFLVTKQRKEIWAIELDLLMALDAICKKHGLTYCIGAGTMLGAVRHKGFIPWDDDVDVYMPRADYDRLIRMDDEFQMPYFLQTPYNEKYLLRTFMRLRNTKTTGTTVKEQELPVNKGLFIDIFPLDGISGNPGADKRQYWVNRIQKNICGCYNHSFIPLKGKSVKEKIRLIGYRAVARTFVHNKVSTYERVANNIRKYSTDETKLWGNRTLFFKCPKSRRPKEDYTDLITMPFEGFDVPVPRKYHELLTQQYGDYMKIPENKNGSVHGELIVSTDYAYDDPRRTAI